MIKFPKKIEDECISLVEISTKYFDDFYKYSNHKEFYKYLERDKYKNKSAARKYLEQDLIPRNNKKDSFYFFILNKSTSMVVGSIGIFNINELRKSCEISYGIGPKYWGEGFFSRASKIILEILFIKIKLNRIQAITASDNINSINALKRNGFVNEVNIKNYYYSDKNKFFDASIYTIIANDFLKGN